MKHQYVLSVLLGNSSFCCITDSFTEWDSVEYSFTMDCFISQGSHTSDKCKSSDQCHKLTSGFSLLSGIITRAFLLFYSSTMSLEFFLNRAELSFNCQWIQGIWKITEAWIEIILKIFSVNHINVHQNLFDWQHNYLLIKWKQTKFFHQYLPNIERKPGHQKNILTRTIRCFTQTKLAMSALFFCLNLKLIDFNFNSMCPWKFKFQ